MHLHVSTQWKKVVFYLCQDFLFVSYGCKWGWLKSKDDIWGDILSEYIYIIDDFIFT